MSTLLSLTSTSVMDNLFERDILTDGGMIQLTIEVQDFAIEVFFGYDITLDKGVSLLRICFCFSVVGCSRVEGQHLLTSDYISAKTPAIRSDLRRWTDCACTLIFVYLSLTVCFLSCFCQYFHWPIVACASLRTLDIKEDRKI